MFEKTSLKSRLLLIATVPITVMLVLGLVIPPEIKGIQK